MCNHQGSPDHQDFLAFLLLRAERRGDGLFPMPFPRKQTLGKITAWLLAVFCVLTFETFAQQARVNLADGFDFPVGKPNADGY